MQPSLSAEEQKLDAKLEILLNQFEREVAPYDKWSGLSAALATPVGIILSIFLPLAIVLLSANTAPYSAIASGGPALYWIIGGILATIALSKLPLFYVDRKKHEISRTKYRPVAGVCMCDLSQLRSQMQKMEKAKTTGQRLRHAKLASYYRQQMGWQ